MPQTWDFFWPEKKTGKQRLKPGKWTFSIFSPNKGKKCEIIELIKKINKVKFKLINFIKKHEKTTKEKKGGIITKENFIDISNIKILDSIDKKTKVVNKK